MSGATLNPAHGMVKVVGGILWLVGLIMLFVSSGLGFILLVIALILSILSLTWTRQARHNQQIETVAATTLAVEQAMKRQSPQSAAPDLPTDTTSDRLRDLKKLHDDGLITDDEYEQKRSRIVEQL